jgi:hypothetical protein
MWPVVTHGKHKKNKPRQIGKNSGLIYNIKIKRINRSAVIRLLKGNAQSRIPKNTEKLISRPLSLLSRVNMSVRERLTFPANSIP